MSNEKPMSNEIRVLLVDDHAMLRKGIALLLGEEPDITVVGEAGDGEEAIVQVRALQPDVVIMDITMPRLNGIEATRQIVAESPHSKVIALSIHSAKRFVDDMLKAGAAGYLLKESVPEELVRGIRTVMHGDMYLSSATTCTVISAYIEGMPGELADEPSAVDISILQTKLHRPPITPELVPRTQLLARLEADRNLPLTLVSAPAGYGKSVSISSWLAQSEWPSAWLSLDADDSDLRQFLLYLVAAVQSIFPRACAASRNMAKSLQLPPLPVLVASITNELDTLDQPFILVLDDYHRINGQSPVNKLLQLILEHPPIPLHLVIITRRDPALPLLTLRANGQVNEIRMQDLEFDTTETRALLQGTGGFTASDDALVKLQQELEGWAAGLRLVSLAMRRTEDPEGFIMHLPGGLQQSQEYMIQEVITGLPPRLRDCLLKSAIFDRFCEPLCHAVCAEEGDIKNFDFNGSRFIQTLRDDNLFVIPLDDNAEWFRYHHLFQHLLQRELKRHISPDEIAVLHIRAIKWFESKGLIEEALRHAMTTGDTACSARVVEANRLAALNTDQWQRVGKWLTSLPEEAKRQRPALLLAQGWVLMENQRIAEIGDIVEQIESLSDEVPLEPALLGELNFLRGVPLYYEGQVQRSQELFEKALEQLPRSCPVMVGEAELHLALARQSNSQSEQAISKLNQSIQDVNPRETMRLGRLLAGLAFVHQMDGELQLLAAAARRLQELCTTIQGMEYAMSWANYMQAYCHLHAFDLETAQHSFAILEKLRYIMHPVAAIDAMAALALTYQLMHRPGDATETITKMLEFAAASDAPENLSIAHSCQARIALLQGDINAAAGWLRSNQAAPHPPSMLFWIEIPALTQARVQIALGSDESLQQAAESLQRLKEQTEAVNNICQTIEILILLSVALEKLGRAEKALTVLQEALALAGPRGWIRPFVELGQPMAELLERLAEQKGSTDYLRCVLNKFPASEAQPAGTAAGESRPIADRVAWTGEALTRRELEILGLLAQRLQNKEIAAKLFVSPETVKSHLKHLYQKLGVSSRREAAARAADIIATCTDAK